MALTLGLIAVAAVGAGTTMIFLAGPGQGGTGGGALIRVGAVLGAVALALPTVRPPSLTRLVLVVSGLVVALARPGLVWAGLLAWLGYWLMSRQRNTADRDS